MTIAIFLNSLTSLYELKYNHILAISLVQQLQCILKFLNDKLELLKTPEKQEQQTAVWKVTADSVNILLLNTQ